MEELFNLNYKDEVEELKDEENFEELGDQKYIKHPDSEARLYWAFCRPSGSHPNQIADSDPLVSIMAFNHSRLSALPRFKLLHSDVINNDHLRVKIRNRARMLFRDLVDQDFKELNQVLDLVPVFISVAVDQLKNGRKWNDIPADEIEATKFIEKSKYLLEDEFFEALFLKLRDLSEMDAGEIKELLADLIVKKDQIDKIILEHYQKKIKEWCDDSDLHILQLKTLQNLAKKLL